MKKNGHIKVGDTVQATFAWREDEQPSEKNFFTGKVTNIIRKGRGIVYVQLEKLERAMPEDRCKLLA